MELAWGGVNGEHWREVRGALGCVVLQPLLGSPGACPTVTTQKCVRKGEQMGVCVCVCSCGVIAIVLCVCLCVRTSEREREREREIADVLMGGRRGVVELWDHLLLSLSLAL